MTQQELTERANEWMSQMERRLFTIIRGETKHARLKLLQECLEDTEKLLTDVRTYFIEHEKELTPQQGGELAHTVHSLSETRNTLLARIDAAQKLLNTLN